MFIWWSFGNVRDLRWRLGHFVSNAQTALKPGKLIIESYFIVKDSWTAPHTSGEIYPVHQRTSIWRNTAAIIPPWHSHSLKHHWLWHLNPISVTDDIIWHRWLNSLSCGGSRARCSVSFFLSIHSSRECPPVLRGGLRPVSQSLAWPQSLMGTKCVNLNDLSPMAGRDTLEDDYRGYWRTDTGLSH